MPLKTRKAKLHLSTSAPDRSRLNNSTKDNGIWRGPQRLAGAFEVEFEPPRWDRTVRSAPDDRRGTFYCCILIQRVVNEDSSVRTTPRKLPSPAVYLIQYAATSGVKGSGQSLRL